MGKKELKVTLNIALLHKPDAVFQYLKFFFTADLLSISCVSVDIFYF